MIGYWLAGPVLVFVLLAAVRWLLCVPPYDSRSDWRKRQ